MPNTNHVTVDQLTMYSRGAEVKNDARFAQKSIVNSISAILNTLVGSDSSKSARTIAAEELAAQLIPENANEARDTLVEIAAWIQNHPADAAAMNSAIQALQTYTDVGSREVFIACKPGDKYDPTKQYYSTNSYGSIIDTSGYEAGVTDVSAWFVKEDVPYEDIDQYVNESVQKVFDNLYNFVESNYSNTDSTNAAINNAISNIVHPTADDEDIYQIIERMYTYPELVQCNGVDTYNWEYDYYEDQYGINKVDVSALGWTNETVVTTDYYRTVNAVNGAPD